MSEVPEPRGAAEGPEAAAGARLRAAREAAGWSQAEVAARLRVPRRYVEALEAGRIADLPGAVFARGYVRAYARLVELPADELLGDFDLPPVEAAAPRPRVVGRSAVETLALRWGTAALLVAAAGLGYWWWQGREDVAVTEPAGAAAPLPPSAVAPAPPAVTDAAMSSAPVEAIGERATAPGPEEGPVLAAAPAEAAGIAAEAEAAKAGGEAEGITTPVHAGTEAGEVAAGEQAPAPGSTPQEEAAPAAAGAAATETARGERPVTAATAATEAAAGTAASTADVLEIRVAGGDSWVEVRDSRGERLVYALLRDGAVRRVTGLAPFSLLLGNGRVVGATLNGRPLTLPEPGRSGVVRLRTPQE